MSLEPSSLRITDPGIQPLFTEDARWQSWLDVEAALALAEAELGMIPMAAAEIIKDKARLTLLDRAAIQEGLVRTAHPLVPLVWELARICGEEVGGYVHWGATTQNILETGDALQLRRAHTILLKQLGQLLTGLAEVAERCADMPAAGRTHGQHAVPVTFGYKVAVWIDELLRQVERLRALEGRVFIAMLGGAAGTFASFGAQGFEVQARLAKHLALQPTPVPSRTHRDREAEYVCALGLLAGTAGKIGTEMYTLMKQEFGEAGEPVPPGTVGSSTMPQKRNPILAQDIRAGAAQVRALVPLALESMMTEHEADRTTTVMMRSALGPTCVHMGNILARLIAIAEGMWVDEVRMRRNLDLTEGMILAEAVMLELGGRLGRQVAHDLVYDAIEVIRETGGSFSAVLAADPRIKAHLNEAAIEGLLNPAAYTGLCGQMAREQAVLARDCASSLLGLPL